jgi:hypothetical protein
MNADLYAAHRLDEDRWAILAPTDIGDAPAPTASRSSTTPGKRGTPIVRIASG